MSPATKAGRPRGALAEPAHTITGRVRRLIDTVHEGKVRDASRLTRIPYPTLNDLYIGRNANPSLATLEKLRRPYGIDLSWLLSDAAPVESPRRGIVAYLPPDPTADLKRRSLREVFIPYTAWSMCEVFTKLEEALEAMESNADRPIVGEASGDALRFRLSTFLLQPLLAAEKVGERNVFVEASSEGEEDSSRNERWTEMLESLAATWRAALPGLLKAQGAR